MNLFEFSTVREHSVTTGQILSGIGVVPVIAVSIGMP